MYIWFHSEFWDVKYKTDILPKIIEKTTLLRRTTLRRHTYGQINLQKNSFAKKSWSQKYIAAAELSEHLIIHGAVNQNLKIQIQNYF